MRSVSCLLLLSLIPAGILAAEPPAAPEATKQPASTVPAGVVAQEEDASGGRRVRVSTPTVTFSESASDKLGLRLECLHPVGPRVEPKNCLVYVVNTARAQKYSLQHNTSFQVEADKKKVFDRDLSNFGANQDGANIVEPLVGFWDFSLLKTLASAKEVTFTVGGDKFAVSRATIEAIDAMVKYFAGAPGV